MINFFSTVYSLIAFDAIFLIQSSEFIKPLNFGRIKKKLKKIPKILNFLRFFFEVFVKLLPNFSDFINSDDCIRKISSKYIGIYPVLISKNI